MPVSIKIECVCGQKYAFDVEVEDGHMPVEVSCPGCGADETAAANQEIAGLLGTRASEPKIVAVKGGAARRTWAILGAAVFSAVLVAWFGWRILDPKPRKQPAKVSTISAKPSPRHEESLGHQQTNEDSSRLVVAHSNKQTSTTESQTKSETPEDVRPPIGTWRLMTDKDNNGGQLVATLGFVRRGAMERNLDFRTVYHATRARLSVTSPDLAAYLTRAEARRQ